MDISTGFRQLLGPVAPREVKFDESLNPYVYDVLPDASTHIRLATILPSADPNATIECTLQTFLLTATPTYYALSYACGDSNFKRTILLHGVPVRVYRNLECALKRIRPLLGKAGDRTPLWIDAVCINQVDKDEKSIQVRHMSKTYRKAGTLFAWLGEATDDTIRTLDMLMRLGNPDWIDAWTTLKATWPTLSFERRSQELEVIRHSLHNIKDYTADHSETQSTLFDTSPAQRDCSENDLMLSAVFDDRSYLGLGSDPRDKIYALLGASTDRLAKAITPDYSQPTVSIYMNFVQTWLDVYQNLNVLKYCHGPMLGFPGWVPDFDNMRMSIGNSCLQSLYAAHGSSIAEYKRSKGHNRSDLLLLQGFTADYVNNIGDIMYEDSTSHDEVLPQWRSLAALTAQSATAFWTTLTMELSQYSEKMTADEMQIFFQDLENCNNFEDPATKWPNEAFEECIWRGSWRRRFFTTREGRIGLTNADLQINDEVCVLFGGQAPFVLRSVDHGEHMLCGEAYVHGIMDGEAMVDYEAGNYTKQEYRIR